MIRILDRLVVSTFFRTFFLCLAASPILFVIGDITENLDDYIDRGLTGAEVASAYFYQMPQFIRWSFPIATLLATVFTIHGMTTHRELVAAKAGGISFHRVVAPLMVIGVLLTGVALFITEIEPRGNRVAAQILRRETPGRTFRSDFVYRSESGLTWQVGRLTANDGRMNSVVIERPPTPDQAGLHVLAEEARWDSISGWTLERGYLRTLAADSTETSVEFEKMRMAGLVERPEELLETPHEPEEMTYAEIDHFAKIIQRTGGNAKELLVRREQKISLAVATLVVILFGAPLATSSKRGGAAYGVGVSLGTVILYLLMFKVSGALGEAGAFSAMTAAWLPNGLFLAGAVILLFRVRT
jgi:lipopolysaccharide export system permease protein